MASTMLDVRKIFNMAQDGVVASRLCDMMTAIQKTCSVEDFWSAFLNHLQKTMIYYKADIVVERVIDFIATFTTHSSILKNKEKENESDNLEMDESSMDPFLVEVLNFLIKNHNARDKAVRYRCCQLINKLLGRLGDDDTIDEDICDAIYECMMIRIKDKFPSIRIQAVLALVRLQDPEDEECPVIDAFIHSMETDTNADVRKTILSNIALSRKTLRHVLGRIRDVKESNRKVAYITLSEKVSIRALTIAQRIDILSVGLKDRSVIIKQACLQLLKSWLRSYDHNVVKLLEALDTEGSKDCSEAVLDALFEGASVEKLKQHVDALIALSQASGEGVKMIPSESLSPENVFYWYMVCKHLKKVGDDGEVLLQTILPELTNFCNYIQSYAEKYFIDSAILTAFEGRELQPEFILEHLLKIARLLDLSDEVGRKNLQSLVYNLLVTETIPVSLASVLVSLYVDVEKSEQVFVQAVVEIIADVKQPMVQVVTTAMKESNRRIELQLARIAMNLNECKEDLETAITKQNFQDAALLKDQIAELQEQRDSLLLDKNTNEERHLPQRVEKDDPETMLKCLTIASSLLTHIKGKGISPTLMTLKDELIFEGVKNEDPFIRNEAVKCLGHLSLLQKDFACQHLVLFLQVAQVDQELLQITAVQIIFDLFMIYGLEAFDIEPDKPSDQNEEDEVKSDVVEETPPEELEVKQKHSNAAESVLGILLMFLESESPDLRTVVAEGLVKLLMSGRIVSSKILTRLILLWYNPITEDDTKLRHCLGVFLPVFAFENRNNQELIEESFIPVLKTLFNAPSSSPLSQVNVSNVVDLMVQLTDVRNLVEMQMKDKTIPVFESHVHDGVAIKLANEILSDPEDADIKLLCKTLNQLHICVRNTTVIQDLMELNMQMLEALSQNKLAKKMIEKFQLHVQDLFGSQDKSDSVSQSEADATMTEENKDTHESTTDTLDQKKHKLNSTSDDTILSKKSKLDSDSTGMDVDFNVHNSTRPDEQENEES
ncbi:condensin complex subunit 3-like isoform X2 [Hydractinia symbiolongicarpus]|uniref:condensin complex subunit 3-like isoform X2 n=1 Tax=Hydractinia symbiolongicarpus TaxID=13093 RepID=UPI00254D2851|nr:condensin complex subunit 3-like isoform X2 [Hydractinia symbiolongicarpus]